MMDFDIRHVPGALRAFFAENPRVALALSGGCDSAYLYYAARACGAEVLACFVRSPFQPAFELEDALRIAPEARVIEADVLSDENVRANRADRCYHCKRRLLGAIGKAAAAEGFICIIDGTNASDDAGDRPGMRALRELGVRSPLRECGVTKAQLRALSREAGIFVWNKPAYACLATRIAAGNAIEADVLKRIERGEALLAELGFSDFRLRWEQGGARLELTEADMARALEKRKVLLDALGRDFARVTLDLNPRKDMEI